MSSDAVKELEVELQGFYVGSVSSTGDRPLAPDEVRAWPILRFHSGEVIGYIYMSTRDAGILSRQLNAGVESPRLVVRLARKLLELRK